MRNIFVFYPNHKPFIILHKLMIKPVLYYSVETLAQLNIMSDRSD